MDATDKPGNCETTKLLRLLNRPAEAANATAVAISSSAMAGCERTRAGDRSMNSRATLRRGRGRYHIIPLRFVDPRPKRFCDEFEMMRAVTRNASFSGPGEERDEQSERLRTENRFPASDRSKLPHTAYTSLRASFLPPSKSLSSLVPFPPIRFPFRFLPRCGGRIHRGISRFAFCIPHFATRARSASRVRRRANLA